MSFRDCRIASSTESSLLSFFFFVGGFDVSDVKCRVDDGLEELERF